MEDCPPLRSLTKLQFSNCEAAAGDWEAVLGAVLSQAPLLSSLLVKHCLHGALPQCLIAHTGLQELTLWENDLATLPAGPYLASLQQLDCLDDSLLQLPAALAAATALTCLEVQREPLNFCPPFEATSLDGVLSHLTRLRQLRLAHCGYQNLALEGWPGIAALQALDLSGNSLTALPAALHQATALRKLNLRINTSLAPTAQQLGALLSRLPLLEELDLAATGLTELPPSFLPGKLGLHGIGCNVWAAVHSLGSTIKNSIALAKHFRLA